MAEAGKQEQEHAVAIGSVNEKGTPMIPVTGDACWSKRSYGTNYCASSGAGAIVGMYSKTSHICFKNFDGPSTAMEAAVITEGFKSSLDDHGLIYNQYVADGYSSTYASIRNSRPYESVTGQLRITGHSRRSRPERFLGHESKELASSSRRTRAGVYTLASASFWLLHRAAQVVFVVV
ncbi:unnamed protein product [Plutella xylostella]|uniref:(diamondback moth) hypothetical protein n=1 Tax=Plutella xylostella TaxID=51655 RepID=A0A8S4FRN3_PLUXY|nr:unnamed protein product [Plutella xylostella]